MGMMKWGCWTGFVLENRNSLDQVLTKFEYGLLDNGMRGSVVETFGQEKTTLQWTYDNLGRLLGELCYETDDPCNVIYEDSYVYDLVSNRLSKTEDGTAAYYHYNENDQLLAESADEEGLNISFCYLYDDNGSLIKKVYGADSADDPNDSYEYDFRNKLMLFVSSDGDVIGYGYDPDGIRVEKESGGTATEYLIDPANLTGYSQIFSESDGVDTLTYIIGLDVLSQVAGSTPGYFEYDGHGSVRRLTDGTGAVIGSPDNEQIYHYDAFGNAVQLPQNPLTNLRYVGEYYNPLPGLYGLRARDYEPLTDRFLTHDPFRGNLQEPLSLHRYLYCYGNPINNIDPTGEFFIVDFVAVQNWMVKMRVRTATMGATAAEFGRRVITEAQIFQYRSMIIAENLFGRPWTQSLRRNLIRVTGDLGSKFQAHHILPRQFANTLNPILNKIGMDINNPMFGIWLKRGTHIGIHSEGYNLQWQIFLGENRTAAEVLNYAKTLAEQYGFQTFIP